ncbi:MAG: ABC-F family ATP-binding cassette domain-containing protein [Clostridia bacterium]|nr:ABC-F family ATP-binding cassette domain-containing protein [Clostridia bacterium]
MSMIDVSGLTFGYEGSTENIFENVSFRLDTDWKLGFTGRNGRGKTTFMNLLLGKFPYQGKITASVDFEYFPYEVKDASAFAIDAAREVYDFEDWELMRELNRLRVDEDVLWRPWNTLSMGERTKVLLAVLFLKPGSFLLIDEPTNHLDAEARTLTAAYLNSKRGFILVSHDRAFLDACTDHTLSINRASIEVTAGSFSVWYENKLRQDAFETAQNDRLKKEIARLRETAREKASWSDKTESSKIGTGSYDRGFIGHKAQKMMSRAKAIEKRTEAKIEEKSSLLKNVEEYEDLKLHPLTHHAPRLVSFDGASLCYGDTPAVTGLKFDITRGARVCLSGANGCGKSTVIKAILGDPAVRVEGKASIASGLTISYVPQDVSGLSGSLEDFESASGVDVVLFRAILRKLDFSREMFTLPMEAYSAGQKKKAALARSLAGSAHLYIWDEPLNYIDIYSRMQIERLLADSGATLLFVEHDRRFCDAIATDVVKM